MDHLESVSYNHLIDKLDYNIDLNVDENNIATLFLDSSNDNLFKIASTLNKIQESQEIKVLLIEIQCSTNQDFDKSNVQNEEFMNSSLFWIFDLSKS